MSKLIKERYKRYLVEAVEDMPFEGSYNKRVIFTTDDREELTNYLAEMPSEYDMDEISVFDCDERMFVTEEFTIGFAKREPTVYPKESSFVPELWAEPVKSFLNHPSIFINKQL